MKDKTAEENKKAIQRIIEKGARIPAIIYTDGGTEFKIVFEEYLKLKKIFKLTNQNAPNIKAAMV